MKKSGMVEINRAQGKFASAFYLTVEAWGKEFIARNQDH